MTTTRTPEEVFAHHGQALGAEDLEDIVADYTEDALLVVQKKVYRGKDGARQVFTQLLSDVPQASWELETVFADDVLYLEWKATGGGRKVQDGTSSLPESVRRERDKPARSQRLRVAKVLATTG